MQLSFINNSSFSDLVLEELPNLFGSDVLVCGFDVIDKVCLKSEAEGKDSSIIDLAVLSKNLDTVVLAGCEIDVYGGMHKSVVVTDFGQLSGISDMVHIIDGGKYLAGGNFRVYETSAGKIGVVVSDDIYFSDVYSILTSCDSDYIVCIFDGEIDDTTECICKAMAYMNGVDIIVAAKNKCMVCNIKGQVEFSSEESLSKFKLKTQKNYRLISKRKRGCAK